MIGMRIKKGVLTFSGCLTTVTANNGKLMQSRCERVNMMRFVGRLAYPQLKYGNGLLCLQGIFPLRLII